MKVLIFTKEDGPETRDAKEFGDNLVTEGYEVEYLDANDEKTTAQTEVYDVYSYPTFIVVRENGSEVERWRGQVPIAGDLRNFLN